MSAHRRLEHPALSSGFFFIADLDRLVARQAVELSGGAHRSDFI
jgi:hypothetical protein